MEPNDALLSLLEALANCDPCDHIPNVAGISLDQRAHLMSRLYQSGWINTSQFLGDGSLIGGQLLMLTDAGRNALQVARDRQDANAADPPSVDLAEKRKRRFELMKRLYEQAGANTTAIVSSQTVGSSLGWTDDITKPVVRYLAEKGLVAYRSLAGEISITTKGVDEVESAMSPTSEGTENLAGIRFSTGDVSGRIQVIQQRGSGRHRVNAGPASPSRKGFLEKLGGWIWVVILGAIGSLVAAAILATGSHGGDHAGGGPSVPSTRSSIGPTSLSGGAVVEYADNRSGSPVFADPNGSPVPDPTPIRIPFGTAVNVSCKAPNRSGIQSVTAFYLIADGQWKGDYVVADTMTNGVAIGSTGGPNVDPRVPDCQ